MPRPCTRRECSCAPSRAPGSTTGDDLNLTLLKPILTTERHALKVADTQAELAQQYLDSPDQGTGP